MKIYKLFKINGDNGDTIWEKEIRSSNEVYKNEKLYITYSKVLGLDHYDNLIFFGYIPTYDKQFIANITNNDGNTVWEKFVNPKTDSENYPAYHIPNNKEYFRIDDKNNIYIFEVQDSKNVVELVGKKEQMKVKYGLALTLIVKTEVEKHKQKESYFVPFL